MDSLEKLLEKLKQDKNLNTDLGVRIDINDFEILSGSVFLVKNGIVWINEDKISEIKVAQVWKYLSEEIAVRNYHDIAALGDLRFLEECFLVNNELGIISIRQIEKLAVFNSRFWARKIRNYLKE